MVYFAMTQMVLGHGINAFNGLGILASNEIQRARKNIIKIILNKSNTYFSI